MKERIWPDTGKNLPKIVLVPAKIILGAASSPGDKIIALWKPLLEKGKGNLVPFQEMSIAAKTEVV